MEENWPDRRREKRLARLIGLLLPWKKECFVSSALKIKFLGELEDGFFEYNDFESINIRRYIYERYFFLYFCFNLELELEQTLKNLILHCTLE